MRQCSLHSLYGIASRQIALGLKSLPGTTQIAHYTNRSPCIKDIRNS